jgi:hypothetical protein
MSDEPTGLNPIKLNSDNHTGADLIYGPVWLIDQRLAD